MVLISLVISGAIFGALGRLAVPGPNPMSIGMTILVGIGGALLGSVVGALLGVAVAGSFLAANTVFNVSPKDGSVIAIAAPTTPLDERLAMIDEAIALANDPTDALWVAGLYVLAQNLEICGVTKTGAQGGFNLFDVTAAVTGNGSGVSRTSDAARPAACATSTSCAT